MKTTLTTDAIYRIEADLHANELTAQTLESELDSLKDAAAAMRTSRAIQGLRSEGAAAMAPAIAIVEARVEAIRVELDELWRRHCELEELLENN